MDFFVTSTEGVWLLESEHELIMKRVGDQLFIFHVLNNSDYTKELIKIALDSSGIPREVEQRLADLTKLERFTFLAISNRSRTYREKPIERLINCDHYVRFSHISMSYYVKGSFTGISPDRSFTIKDDNTKAVLARLPVINNDVMDGLKMTGVLRYGMYVEYPWVNDFKFTQPAGSTPPADMHQGNQ